MKPTKTSLLTLLVVTGSIYGLSPQTALSANEPPICNPVFEGFVFYFFEEEGFKICDGSDFVAVDLGIADIDLRKAAIGEKGPKGVTGPQGPTGVIGEPGAKGPNGLAGVKGETGIQGEAGITGGQGPTGAKGETGDQGAQGSKGTAGTDGENASVATLNVANSALAVSDVETYSAKTTWTRATETTELSKNDFEYLVAFSTSDNLNSISDVGQNGTISLAWSSGKGSHTLEGLTKGTTYYVAVLARGPLGGSFLYDRNSFTTKDDPIILFQTSAVFNGDLGGRSGADAKCKVEHDSLGLNRTHTRAFASFSYTDDIRLMTKNYSIPTNRPIETLANHTYMTSIENLFVEDGISPDFVWTGVSSLWLSASEERGEFKPEWSCSGLTSGASSSAVVAQFSNSFTTFKANSAGSNCSGSFVVTCLSWND